MPGSNSQPKHALPPVQLFFIHFQLTFFSFSSSHVRFKFFVNHTPLGGPNPRESYFLVNVLRVNQKMKSIYFADTR